MAIVTVFQSGTQIIDGGVYQVTTPPQPSTTFTKEFIMYGATALSAFAGSYRETAVTRPLWTADAPAQVLGCYSRISVGGSTTGMLVKASGSTPIGSGLPVLSTALSMTTSTDITQSGVLYVSAALQQLAVGDQLGLLWGTPAALPPTGVWTVVLSYI